MSCYILVSKYFVLIKIVEYRTINCINASTGHTAVTLEASERTQARIAKMTNYKFRGKLGELIERAELGNDDDVDYIMSHLTNNSSLAMTRFVDYALSIVKNQKGIIRLEYYLFFGTIMQRNYSSLFFNRRLDYDIVKRAYKEGRIDAIQAYAR